MRVCDLPDHIADDIVENGIYGMADEVTADQAFEAWCTWQGFLGWSQTIAETLREIERAEATP